MLLLECAIVIEPSELLREGLIKVITESGCETCRGYASVEAAEDDLRDEGTLAEQNILFLVDPGPLPAEVTRCVSKLCALYPDSHVVVLSDAYTPEHLVSALRAGADSYVLSTVAREALLKSLELVAAGGHCIPNAAMDWLASQQHVKEANSTSLEFRRLGAAAEPSKSFNLLSKRELEILHGLSEGMSNKLIARRWQISEATVKVHVKAILRKIRAKNRTEAAHWAWDHGLHSFGAATSPPASSS